MIEEIRVFLARFGGEVPLHESINRQTLTQEL